jgi:ABC-type multidrug transport system fused ATPase/permease subunit
MTQIIPTWQERRTSHAHIYYEPRSFAAQRVEQLCERIDAAIARGWEWIGAGSAVPEVTCYFTSWLPSDVGDWFATPGALLAREQLAVWLLVSPESPGLGLEFALFHALLRAAGRASRDRQRAQVLERALAQVRVSDTLPEEIQGMLRALAGFAAALHDGAVEAADRQAYERHATGLEATNLFHGSGSAWVERTPPTAEVTEISFLGFLLQSQGSIALARFTQAALTRGAEAAATSTYARSLDALQADWLAALRTRHRPPATIGYLMQHSAALLRPHRFMVAAVLFFMVLDLLVGYAITLSSKFLFDVVIPGRDALLLATLVGFVLGAYVFDTFISFQREMLSGRISELILRNARLAMFSHLQRLSTRFHMTVSAGDLIARMTYDLDNVEATLSGTLPNLVFNLLTFFIGTVCLLFLNWALGLVVLLVGLPILIFVNLRASGRIRAMHLELSQQIGAVSSFVEESLGAQALIKVFSLEERQIAAFTARVHRLFDTAIGAIRFSAVLSRLSGSVLVAIHGFVLVGGSFLIMNDLMTIGDLFAFMTIVNQVIGPATALSGQYNQLVAVTGSFDRVQEILRQQPDVVEDPRASDLHPLAREIRLENVSFSYGATPTLVNLNLQIRYGERVAIVGGSGAGKSTVIGLLLRLYDPGQGRVLFDGRDIRTATIGSLRRQIAVVPQDTVLFNTTVRENIALGREGASDEQIVRAAQAAAIHEVIEQLEDGYDTVVGERGMRLSGGQRQRVAIARALIRDPRLLILDEATSALDAQTEAAILHTLEEAARGRTTVMITHRIAAAAQCDRIIVLDRGRLVEEGTHADLVQRRGVYWQLYSEQQGGAEEAQPLSAAARRLADVPLFAGLSPSDLAAVASRLSQERHPAGRVVVREGETADRLFVIADGQAEALVDDREGNLQQLRVLGPRQYFGEIALLGPEGGRRTATVRALTDLELYTLHKEDFHVLLRSQPRLAEAVKQVAQERLARSAAVLEPPTPPPAAPPPQPPPSPPLAAPSPLPPQAAAPEPSPTDETRRMPVVRPEE